MCFSLWVRGLLRSQLFLSLFSFSVFECGMSSFYRMTLDGHLGGVGRLSLTSHAYFAAPVRRGRKAV